MCKKFTLILSAVNVKKGMDFAIVLDDLKNMQNDCNERRISSASKWAAEMQFYVYENVDETVKSQLNLISSNVVGTTTNQELVAKCMSQNCLDCQEFERAAKYADGYDNNILKFLHFYGLYLAGEKKRLDGMADVLDKTLQLENPYLHRLQNELLAVYQTDSMDAFLLYIYGLVLNDQHLSNEAETVFVESIEKSPRFWFAWFELSKLINSKEKLQAFTLPDHWMKRLFYGEVYQKLQMLKESMQIYEELRSCDGFKNCPYILTQLAVVHHNLQNPDAVLEIFKEIQNKDEFRLDHVDTFSNSFFVKTMTAELASLAHHCFSVNKYSPETCSVLGNYYSVRGEHDKAIMYFQRAVKLNPNNSGAFTLMGHEFIEFKNTSAASLAYRKALEIDPKDFRAWYGLGQVYDILKMPNYATYYYNMAHKVRPQDSRMIIAMGDMYEKHQKLDEARKCFWKAHCVGDMEGLALLKLGKLHEKMKDTEQAASSYTMYLQLLEDQGTSDSDQQPGCYRFLADYYLGKSRLDEAHSYAQMCLEFDTTKEDGKSLLKRISQMRGDKPTELITTPSI